MRRVLLSPDALRQLRALRVHDQRLLQAALIEQLQDADAAEETRNRFRLRRPSAAADYELRVRELRAFYRVAGTQVQVVMIGRKVGNQLFVDGRRFVL